MVECLPSKQNVEGSSPFSRSQKSPCNQCRRPPTQVAVLQMMARWLPNGYVLHRVRAGWPFLSASRRYELVELLPYHRSYVLRDLSPRCHDCCFTLYQKMSFLDVYCLSSIVETEPSDADPFACRLGARAAPISTYPQRFTTADGMEMVADSCVRLTRERRKLKENLLDVLGATCLHGRDGQAHGRPTTGHSGDMYRDAPIGSERQRPC